MLGGVVEMSVNATLTLTATVAYLFGATFNVSATPTGMSWYVGGGVIIGGATWSQDGDIQLETGGGH